MSWRQLKEGSKGERTLLTEFLVVVQPQNCHDDYSYFSLQYLEVLHDLGDCKIMYVILPSC